MMPVAGSRFESLPPRVSSTHSTSISRKYDRPPRVQGEPQRQIAAEQREQRNELAQRDAEREAGQRRQRDAAVKDAGVAQLIEDHAGGKKSDEPAPLAEQL